MVRRILNIVHKEFSGLHYAAYLLGAFSILSQILALVRDRLLAHNFGASGVLDVYYASFRIPDLIYVTVASFVSITVLIPFIAGKINIKGQSGRIAARDFLNTIFSAFLLSIGVISIAVFFMVPKLSYLVAPGFADEARLQFISLTRILLFSPILLGISSLFGSVTQTYRRFFVYAGAPVLYNAGIIAGIIFLLPSFGIKGVVYGVLLGAILHMTVQLPVVIRHGLLPKFSLKFNYREIIDVIKLSLPRTATLFATHFILIALVAFASLLESGSIAVFNFSFNLQSVPLAIIGVSYSVAAFPTLARFFADGEREKFSRYVITATKHIVFWSVPGAILFIVLRAQIVRSVLGSGYFDWSDTRLTAASLAVFAVSVPAQALQLLFVRAYYASGRTKIPLIINTLSALFIIVMTFCFYSFFKSNEMFRYFMESLLRVEGLTGTSIIMLPFAYSIGIILNVAALGIFLMRDMRKYLISIHRAFAHIFSASIMSGFFAYRSLFIFEPIFNTDTFMGIFLQGLCSGIAGLLVGALTLRLLRNEELLEISAALKRKFGNGDTVIAAGKEELQ